jgi:hypothetical protein
LWFINLVNFHEWSRPDDRGRRRPDCSPRSLHRLAWLPSVAGYSDQFGTVRRNDWICSFFNRPVAKLSLGDVGFLLDWLLLVLAGTGDRGAAAILPLHYLADSILRSCAGRPMVKRFGWRTGRIFISAYRPRLSGDRSSG